MFNKHEISIFDCDGWNDYDDDDDRDCQHDELVNERRKMPNISYPDSVEEFYCFTHEHDC